MSILTGLVIVVAMATLAQRSDSILDFLTREDAPGISPQNDEALMTAGESRVIDVLKNDENANPEDGENIRIVVSPSCGAAEATSSGVLYISSEFCIGPQLFAYCVEQGDECPSASVTVNVAPTDEGSTRLAQRNFEAEAPARAPNAELGQRAPASTPLAAPTPGEGGAAIAAAPRVSDDAAAPRIAVAGQTSGQLSIQSSRLPASADFGATPLPPTPAQTLAAPQTEPRAVVASVRPTANHGAQIGRLAAAPHIDDGGGAPLPARVDLGDESEPNVYLTPTARPRFYTADDNAPDGPKNGPIDDADGRGVRVAALSSASGGLSDADRGAAPDVSAIETQPAAPEPPTVEVARLQGASPDSSSDRIRDDAVRALRREAADADQTIQAALPPANDQAGTASQAASPAKGGEGCGPATARSTGASGAASMVEIISPCRASERFVLEHAGLRFDGRFDASGAGRLTLPVMSDDGRAVALFADGGTTPVALRFNLRELELTLRVAVAWTAPVDLDLHAFEYAAPFGADGHVWAERPRGFRRVRRSGGGYLASFPAIDEGGQSIEVYTFWANSRARRGVARIALDHASRGDLPAGAYCDDGALASPDYMVVRSERGALKTTSRGRFAAATCGKALDEEARYASGALRDLRIE